MVNFLTLHQLEIISCLLMLATTFQIIMVINTFNLSTNGRFSYYLQVFICCIFFGSTMAVNNKIQTNKKNYNLKSYPLGIKGLKKTNLTYVKTERTLYAEKKKLHFLNNNESIVFEVETSTLSTMLLSEKQPFILYYKTDGSSRCLYKLDRDWASVETLLEGSKNYCTRF